MAGAGAIGCLFGAKMQQAGHEVTLLLRGPAADAIARNGLQIHGHTETAQRIPCITEPGGSYDAILITSKAHATQDLAAATAPLLRPDGVLASMQNGLGNAQKLARVVSPDRVAVGITSHGVTVESPGRIHHAGVGPTTVGPVDGADPSAARAVHKLLQEAGLEPAWSASMRKPVWQKAIVNAALNPIGALYGVRNGEILDDPDLWNLCRSLALEAKSLAVKARVDVADWDVEATLRKVLEATAPNKVSMLQDVEAKRATEIEQITGRMVRLGETLLVSMPRSDLIYGKLKDLERGYLGDAASDALAWNEVRCVIDP